MGGRSELFIVVMAIFVALLLFTTSYYFWLARKTARVGWEHLIGRLRPLDRDSIATIASDNDYSIDPSLISAMISGIEGLEILEANCAVLVDLAYHVQRWYPGALAVAEGLRLNAREIQWHVGRLKAATSEHSLRINFPDYAQRAISIYYVMTRMLLKLYENGNFPGLADLQQVI